MMERKMNERDVLIQLIERNPKLVGCREEIEKVFRAWVSCFEQDGKLLICGNGGSESDSQHIVGELMKEFDKKRTLDAELVRNLELLFPGENIADRLQGALPAIALGTNATLSTAYANDVCPEMIFAQEVNGYGRKEDVLFALSTSGNSVNVLNAVKVAKAKGIKCVGMCGRDGGKLLGLVDECILIGEKDTYLIQELMLPVYHALCRMVELYFWIE